MNDSLSKLRPGAALSLENYERAHLLADERWPLFRSDPILMPPQLLADARFWIAVSEKERLLRELGFGVRPISMPNRKARRVSR